VVAAARPPRVDLAHTAGLENLLLRHNLAQASK
jgi:hypothetical protein